jgi:tetratricopeptide (TPR) repeat protein
LKERTFFLLGQLNDYQGYTQNAFTAFDRVSDYYFNYEIQFEAQKKKADVARQLGLVDEAYSVLADMVKDDKNTEYVADLRLELGLTELQRNRPEKAETIFLDLLRDQQFPAEARTKALTYYALADIYRFNNNNFSLAAAYYDSAARINVPSENLPEYYNAQELSASFGEYARLKSNIQLEDSLLYLGSLEPAQFDSVIQIIQQKQQAELERLQQEQEDRANTLVTIDRESNTGPNSASNSGFLNELDQRVSADASQQFNALWMGRSLTDYWRFESLARNSITQDSSAVESSNEENATIQLQKKYTIDISAIPFDPADKDSAYERLSTYYYGIGNLFFLNLNDTDSAEYYFSKVWAEHPQSKVAPVSLYSLAEIASTRDQINRAKELGEIIVQNFPNTVYAKRTAERFSIPMVQDSSAQPSEYDTFRKLYNNFEMGAEVGLDSLFSWGISARNSILGEQAYRIGLTHYIENITMDSLYQQDQARWLTEKERWVTGQANLLAFKDSIEISLEDSLLDPMEEEELAALLDSNLVEPVWYDLFPYTGLNWDIARNYLAIYDSVFMNPVKNPDLMRLKQELTPPENPYTIAVDSSLNDSLEVHGFLADSLQPDSLSMDSFSNDSLTQVSDLANSVEEGSTIDDYQSCADLDSTPSFRGGIQALLSSISYPEGVIISPVSYRFFINERGIIDRFETVDSASNAELSPDLVEAINARLASEVAFEPTIINGRSIRLVCEIVIDPSELE